MSKRVKGNNAFYFFMLDWRKRNKCQKNLKELAADPACSEEWQNLTPQQKGYYQAKASESKVASQGIRDKKTGIGESIKELEANDKREQEFQENMHQYINSVVAMGMQHKNLSKLKFILIHVNWFFRRETGINQYEFFPAEFAVAEFSLEDGVQNVYHEILNVKIPLGWRRDALETSQQTHQIPIELAEGQSDFSLMYDKLTQLLIRNKTGNKFPPLFTTKDVTLAVESFLIKMTDAAKASIEEFSVYSLEALFGALRNAAAQNVNNCSIPLVVAENEFGKDVFFSICGIECDFHKIIDGTAQYCSQSVVTRWGYTICDYCCEYLGIEMIEGVHCPVSSLSASDQNTVDENISSRFKNLNIGNQKNFVEINGVSTEHRRKVSERTYKEEQRRRNESKPIEIIDHSKLNATKPSTSSIANVPSRPLRLPKTKSYTSEDVNESSDLLSDANFPPLGRGRGITQKKKSTNTKLTLGRGFL
ncbi:Protein maelstrom [Anthophora plagiata]